MMSQTREQRDKEFLEPIRGARKCRTQVPDAAFEEIIGMCLSLPVTRSRARDDAEVRFAERSSVGKDSVGQADRL